MKGSFNCLKYVNPPIRSLATMPLKGVSCLAALFPDLSYAEQKLRYLFSDFTKLLEQYLIQETFHLDRRQAYEYLLKAYVLRGENERFAQKAKEWGKFMRKNPLRDVEHYLQRFRLCRT